jgi:REP element-mobilizing transposase RayT
MHFPRAHRRNSEHYAQIDECFHLTLTAHAKFGTWPDPIREMVWQSVMEQRNDDRVELFAACLMPNHLHLLVSPRRVDVIRFAKQWKSWTTRKSWELGNEGALWQRRFWDRTIRDDKDFGNAADYILRNPVTAGLVEDERAWRHGWATWWEA